MTNAWFSGYDIISVHTKVGNCPNLKLMFNFNIFPGVYIVSNPLKYFPCPHFQAMEKLHFISYFSSFLLHLVGLQWMTLKIERNSAMKENVLQDDN